MAKEKITEIKSVRDCLDWVDQERNHFISTPKELNEFQEKYLEIQRDLYKVKSNNVTVFMFNAEVIKIFITPIEDNKNKLEEQSKEAPTEQLDKLSQEIENTVKKLNIEREKHDEYIKGVGAGWPYIIPDRIKSYFQDKLKQIETQGQQLFFRGHAKTSYFLVPSIFRNHIIKYENDIYKKTLLYKPNELNILENIEHQLVLMQHHGIPTRLLDITSNPLVALFFACYGNKDEDGDDGRLFLFSLGSQDNSKEITQYAKYVTLSDQEISKKEFINHFDFPKNDEKIDDQSSADIFKILKRTKILYPAPKNNPRITVQSGAFFIYGHPVRLESTDDILKSPKKLLSNDFEKADSDIIIPKKYKKEILKELDRLNINFSSLFPDLDGWGNYIKWKYKL